jgi:hypothetical protein
VKHEAGRDTLDVIGLSADGKTLEVVEAKGGSARLKDSNGRTIGHDAAGNKIWAAQGSTDYLNDLLQKDKNIPTLLENKEELAAGLQDGSIQVRYRLAKAPASGNATVADLTIDPSRIDYSFAMRKVTP